MSFCLRPNVCKKCGKPLTIFEGWICLECEKAEQEPQESEEISDTNLKMWEEIFKAESEVSDAGSN